MIDYCNLRQKLVPPCPDAEDWRRHQKLQRHADGGQGILPIHHSTFPLLIYDGWSLIPDLTAVACNLRWSFGCRRAKEDLRFWNFWICFNHYVHFSGSDIHYWLLPILRPIALKTIPQIKTQGNLHPRIGRENVAIGEMPDIDLCIQLPRLAGINTQAHEITEREFSSRVLPIKLHSGNKTGSGYRIV